MRYMVCNSVVALLVVIGMTGALSAQDLDKNLINELAKKEVERILDSTVLDAAIARGIQKFNDSQRQVRQQAQNRQHGIVDEFMPSASAN